MHLHIPDYILLVAAYSAFIFATTSAARTGWLSWRVILLFILSTASISLYIYKSGKEKNSVATIQSRTSQKIPVGASFHPCRSIRHACYGLYNTKLLTNSEPHRRISCRRTTRPWMPCRSFSCCIRRRDIRQVWATPPYPNGQHIPCNVIIAFLLIWQPTYNPYILRVLYYLHARTGTLCWKHNDILPIRTAIQSLCRWQRSYQQSATTIRSGRHSCGNNNCGSTAGSPSTRLHRSDRYMNPTNTIRTARPAYSGLALCCQNADR